MPPAFAPIEWQIRVSKPAVLTGLDGVKFAEVMRIQLEQVRDDGHLFNRCLDNIYLPERRSAWFGHRC